MMFRRVLMCRDGSARTLCVSARQKEQFSKKENTPFFQSYLWTIIVVSSKKMRPIISSENQTISTSPSLARHYCHTYNDDAKNSVSPGQLMNCWNWWTHITTAPSVTGGSVLLGENWKMIQFAVQCAGYSILKVGTVWRLWHPSSVIGQWSCANF